MIRRSAEPLLWMVFSAGGVVAALVLPMLLFLFGVAFPLGWLTPPSAAHLAAVIGHPLYDGLQIKHLNEVIALLCYGSAIVGSVASAYLLATF